MTRVNNVLRDKGTWRPHPKPVTARAVLDHRTEEVQALESFLTTHLTMGLVRFERIDFTTASPSRTQTRLPLESAYCLSVRDRFLGSRRCQPIAETRDSKEPRVVHGQREPSCHG